MTMDSIESVYSALSEARSTADVKKCIQQFTGQAQHSHYICEFLPSDRNMHRALALHNYSDIWLERAARFPNAWYERDPVFAHLRTNPIPIKWARQTYEEAGIHEIWEESSALGIGTGYAASVSCAHGITLRIGISRDEADDRFVDESESLKAHLLLFATCLKARFADLHIPELKQAIPQLTGREKDALKWTRAGKTAWEMGQILGISYATANFHLQNAQKKLLSTDKHQAVLKAIDLQLID